ncbi:MAG: DUF2804 domain-containing protein [Caulobacteraceae bacterium]|nr:DUF2804 domain-containing protein [Caulobacteraceae bacterium]
MTQIELGPGELLDRRGRLSEPGWARREVRRYSRAAIAASPLRIKEWDYYCVLAGDYGLAAVVADNGYMGFLSVTWLDLRAPKATAESVMTPFPLGRMALPQSADAGDIVQDHPRLKLAFRHTPQGRRLSIDCPGFARGQGLSGTIDLAQPPMDRMMIATPFPRAPKAFYYNQKVNCMAASGEIVLGGQRYAFDPASAFGVLDWGRGVWTYHNVWYWGSASGLVDGAPFGFNIGYGFGDTSAASENMLFYDGVAHKLDQVTFHLPQGTYDGAPWRFSSNDGRLEMTFEPILDRADAADFKIIRSIAHQVFGRFSGTATLDDGRVLKIDHLLGFAEQVENAW